MVKVFTPTTKLFKRKGLVHATTATHTPHHEKTNRNIQLNIFNPGLRVKFLDFDFCVSHFYRFNLSFPVLHRGRNWHRFSNFDLKSPLLVGCQRVTEPILSSLLYKLNTHMGGRLISANVKQKTNIFQIFFILF